MVLDWWTCWWGWRFTLCSYKRSKEETGVKNIKALDNKIFSLDVLPVPAHTKRGKEIASHLHLSVAYLLEADENDELIIKEDEIAVLNGYQ